MKKADWFSFNFLLTIFFILCMLFLSSLAASEKRLDRVLAIVNESVITESDLIREINLERMELILSGNDQILDDNSAQQILDEMIVDQLLMQYAEKLKIRINDQQMKYALSMLAKQNNLSMTGLQNVVAKTGVAFTDYVSDLKKQLTIRQLINSRISRRIFVSETEIDNYLKQDVSPKVPNKNEYELSHIVFKSSSNNEKNDSGQDIVLARSVREKILEGLSFNKAAKLYSSDPLAEQGAYLGWRSEEQLPELFLSIIKDMSVGEVSKVFLSPNGAHLIKLLGRKGENEAVIIQRKVRHILIRKSPLLAKEQFEMRLERIRDRIEAGEDFGKVARLQSEDPSTRALGGDLGWINPGQLPIEFEQALEPLSLNSVSPVFETGAGWHIAQITDERRRDLGNAVRRQRVEQTIRSRKIQEAFEQWVQSLREEAFVEYRIRPKEISALSRD